MTTMSVPTITTSAPELKQILVDILARYLGITPADLAARGPGMPVDSLDLFDVLPEFWGATGLKVPTKQLRRRTMQSVDAFVSYVEAWSTQ